MIHKLLVTREELLSCWFLFIVVFHFTLGHCSLHSVPQCVFLFLLVINMRRPCSQQDFHNNNSEILVNCEPLVYIPELGRVVQKKKSFKLAPYKLKNKTKNKTRQQRLSQANPWTVCQQIQPTSHALAHTHTHMHTHMHTTHTHTHTHTHTPTASQMKLFTEKGRSITNY